MINLKAEVLSSAQLSADIFLLSLHAPQLAAQAKPGQFVEVLLSGPGAPFLRRPFGVHSANAASGVVEILFRRVGKGTEILSSLQPGDALDITGPLGNGFTPAKGKTHLLAAGGMGAAPIFFLAQALHGAGEKVKIFLAARGAGDIVRVSDFQKFGDVAISTEDGSLGEKCLIDTPLERALKQEKSAALYACGPHAMLACVAALGAKYNTPTQVSLEEKMACGLGVCQGCPVAVRGGQAKYKMVCKDGPVFNAEDILWQP